ncbi:MAG: hypothetical protein V1778_02015 [bacterium]
MKRFLPHLALLAVLLTVGCATVPGGGFARPLIVVQMQSTFNLKVQAWDNYMRGAFAGAKITVVQTGDHALTCPDGWTRQLAVPPEADHVTVIVEWSTPLYPGGSEICRSYQRDIGLRHGTTQATVDVDTSPPR